MRFWTPKIRTEEKNWSVILNPLRSELDKKRVAEKISELFRLSFEESRELVQSTPLILLDELSHPIALQVQNIFQEIRADITLTADSLIKRRCFRAVWPEPANLSFLNETLFGTIQEKQVIEETPVQTAVQTASSSMIDERVETPSDLVQHLEKRFRELELLYEERTRENEELKRSLEKELKNQTEKSAVEIRTVAADWEERYESLKEEHQETKAIYEEKLLALKDLGMWQEKTGVLEKQNKEYLARLNHLEAAKASLEQAVKEQSEAVSLWREKYQSLAQKAERFESLYEEERKRREQMEESKRQLFEQVERTHREIDDHAAEAERWRQKFKELDENQKRLEQEFSLFSAEQNAEVKRLRETNRQLELQLETAQRQSRDLLFRVEQQEMIERRTQLANELAAKEARLRELALEGERLRQEIQDRELRTQTLGGEQANLEREILEVKQAQRHLLEQSKMKEKNNKFARRAQKSTNGGEAHLENG